MNNAKPRAVQLSLVHQVRPPAAPRPGADGKHPAVIALHGRGSDEADLLMLAPYLDDRLLWISARGPLELEGGYEWYRLPAIGVPDQPSFEAALKAVSAFLDEALAAYPVDPRRVYLFGFSQGGMMGHSLTLTQPGRVAGLIAHSSYIPLKSLEAAARIDADGVRGKPVIIAHGTRDPMIPVRWAREGRDYLAGLGAAVAYHEFPMRHQVSDASMAAIDEWMQKQLDQAGER